MCIRDSLHAGSGRDARSAGFERLYGLGEHSQAAVTAFATGGRHFMALEPLLAALANDLNEGGEPPVVLVKGSRGMRLSLIHIFSPQNSAFNRLVFVAPA